MKSQMKFSYFNFIRQVLKILANDISNICYVINIKMK